MAQKPSIPKGTRDFSPSEMVRRNYIFNTIKDVFRLYGFQPIETPAMENLSTLMGKYGEEGDKLLYQIRSNKNLRHKLERKNITIDGKEYSSVDILDMIYDFWLPQKSEIALKYDLTVPFARFVVQHQNDIAFPFKRYQIQPVWRADRPQKGRYREFYQCDVDVIGSNSLLNEVELVQIIDEVFQRLRINTTVKINNRKILAGIAEAIGEADRMVDITVAIDKLDKIGLEKVNAEMLDKGISQEAVDKLQPILKLEGNTVEKLAQIETVIGGTETGAKGIAEMRTMFAYLENIGLNTTVELDLTLARGLNYYTGAIFEVKSNDVQIGSICGGGRYDDLTGIFGMPDVSGVGVSFGAERIYDVLVQLDAFPEESLETTKALFVNFGEKEEAYCLPVLAQLRKNGVNAEIFPESAKMKKQMTYANRKEIPFVILAGDNEMAAQKFTLKNMETGEQQLLDAQELINILK
nr:histidine--tRNA ligase [uncultured Draconibacterium sp.]